MHSAHAVSFNVQQNIALVSMHTSLLQKFKGDQTKLGCLQLATIHPGGLFTQTKEDIVF